LSHIIQRDFFPNLPHMNATNEYLSALADNDPDKLRASIRKLAKLAQDKEEGRSPGRTERERLDETPRVNRDNGRTPIGARGWETPGTVRRPADDEFPEPGPSRKKPKRGVRDDLGLDAFLRNYTSEDNASFVHIIEEENRMRKEDQNAWAFEAERVAEGRRLEGEERRKMILDAATSGEWRVDADGRRLITGLGSGGTDRAEGEAWKERKMIEARPRDEGSEEGGKKDKRKGKASESTALVKSSAGAVIKATDASSASALPPPPIQEEELPAEHPLSKALVKAGLPPTALVSTEDGAIVPHHESASGSGDGRGRGAAEKARRDTLESSVMGDDGPDLAGGRVQQWPYKVSFLAVCVANSRR
jgi:protein DGCR14